MSQPSDEPSREGQLLAGKYRMERRLGAGGMGEVYRARNELIGREVAIKLLRPEHVGNADLVTRFLREAKAANIVRHPNVVDVLDIGKDDDGSPFIVQELLVGEDLGAHLDRVGGRMSAESALAVLMPVIEAVALAHARGVVHRDIKPENVFLNQAEGGEIVPKVLDFGISKIASTESARVTATGVSMGTPAYMSPEQIQGAGSVDARTDVWALGVMIHELLAGQLPFLAESHGGLFVKICTTDPIALDEAAPGTPPELARIVSRCLRRTPAERYPSAAELARDLKNVAEGRPIEPTRKLAAVTAPSVVLGQRMSALETSAATVGPFQIAGSSRAIALPQESKRRSDAPRDTSASRFEASLLAMADPPRGRSRALIAIAGASVVLVAVLGVVVLRTPGSARAERTVPAATTPPRASEPLPALPERAPELPAPRVAEPTPAPAPVVTGPAPVPAAPATAPAVAEAPAVRTAPSATRRVARPRVMHPVAAIAAPIERPLVRVNSRAATEY